MTTASKLIIFVTVGFGAILSVAYLKELAVDWRTLLVLSGGWLMAVGMLYQVRLYAQQKNVAHYVLVVFVLVLWLGMLALTLFWLDGLTV